MWKRQHLPFYGAVFLLHHNHFYLFFQPCLQGTITVCKTQAEEFILIRVEYNMCCVAVKNEVQWWSDPQLKLTLGTWNVMFLMGKEPELGCGPTRSQLDIVGLTLKHSSGLDTTLHLRVRERVLNDSSEYSAFLESVGGVLEGFPPGNSPISPLM